MELTGTAAVVTLPERLTRASVEAVAAAVSEAVEGPARAVVFTGGSDDTFCLGLALDAQHEADPATTLFADLLLKLHRAPKPTIALVDGRAIGGGLGLAASCDWVIATERSTFALPELLWGLVPAIIWPVVSDRMAPHVARQWTLSAHTRSAADAAAAGLVDEVVAPGSVPKALARAERMVARLETTALVRFRDWARRSRSLALGHAMAEGAAITASMLKTPAARQRWDAFASGEVPW